MNSYREQSSFKQAQIKCGQRIVYAPTNETGIFAGYTWDKYADRYKYCSIHLDNGNTLTDISLTKINKY